ncbi:hypothetical protein SLEP1_g57071, partial [Rubroshorea leprosula]
KPKKQLMWCFPIGLGYHVCCILGIQQTFSSPRPSGSHPLPKSPAAELLSMPKPLRSSSPHAPSAFSLSPSSPGSFSMQAQFSPDPSTPASFPVTIISPMAPKSMNLYPQPLISPSSSCRRPTGSHFSKKRSRRCSSPSSVPSLQFPSFLNSFPCQAPSFN